MCAKVSLLLFASHTYIRMIQQCLDIKTLSFKHEKNGFILMRKRQHKQCIVHKESYIHSMVSANLYNTK